jgi:hypothetical protein
MSILTGAALRAKAKKYVDDNLPLGKEIHSGPANADSPTDGDFFRLTQCMHEALKQAWRSHVPLTTCNLFVGIYSNILFGKALGRFDLATWLPSLGREIAWIPASTGTLPCYGDIFIQQAPKSPKHPNGLNHMGISLDFDGDGKWNTAESGQGGSVTGYDVIKRRSDNDITDAVTGWADINLLAQCIRQKGPVPDWLLGHWDVVWRGQMWYYYFDKNRRVTYTQHEELKDRLPLVFQGEGRFAVNDPGPNGIVTRWTTTGTGEQFWRASGTAEETMLGYVNGVEQIAARKAGDSAIFGSFG